jgi:SP family myo-inositol transporter-like MFS transporter 13
MQRSDEDVELDSMNDAAAEPLISNDRRVPHDVRDRYDEDDTTSIREDEVDESALVSPGLFIWCLTVCAGVSGLLFGYEYVQFIITIFCALLHGI